VSPGSCPARAQSRCLTMLPVLSSCLLPHHRSVLTLPLTPRHLMLDASRPFPMTSFTSLFYSCVFKTGVSAYWSLQTSSYPPAGTRWQRGTLTRQSCSWAPSSPAEALRPPRCPTYPFCHKLGHFFPSAKEITVLKLLRLQYGSLPLQRREWRSLPQTLFTSRAS